MTLYLLIGTHLYIPFSLWVARLMSLLTDQFSFTFNFSIINIFPPLFPLYCDILLFLSLFLP
jgi:hypothetical protein